MDDSIRTRRRIIAFVVSRGGYVTSGQNDNLFAWTFRKIGLSSYKHERVTALRNTIEAMEADGDLILERNSDGRVTSFMLPEEVEIEEISDSDKDLFKSDKELWHLIGMLMRRSNAHRAELTTTLEAFEELSGEEVDQTELIRLRAENALLRQDLQNLTSCNHEAEIEQIRQSAQATVTSVRAACETRISEVVDEFREYRKSANRRYSLDGKKIQQLETQLRQYAHVDQFLSGVSEYTKRVLLSGG